MKISNLYNAVDFPYVLLEGYKKLNLNEDEVVVLLMIDHVLKQGNLMISADTLSLKMNMKIKDIDNALASLLKRGYISYQMSNGGLVLKIDAIKERLYKDLARRIEVDEAASLDSKRSKDLEELANFFEEKLDRGLAPIEQSTLQEWLATNYSVDEIKNAVLDCLALGKKNFNAFQKQLRKNRRRDDVSKERNTAISSNDDTSIEETMKIARELFGED